jgi:hypothetical protein
VQDPPSPTLHASFTCEGFASYDMGKIKIKFKTLFRDLLSPPDAPVLIMEFDSLVVIIPNRVYYFTNGGKWCQINTTTLAHGAQAQAIALDLLSSLSVSLNCTCYSAHIKMNLYMLRWCVSPLIVLMLATDCCAQTSRTQ